MKHTILALLTFGLACTSFAAYDILNLPHGDMELNVNVSRDNVLKIKELDVWSTKLDADVSVSRIRKVDLYTNVYDISYFYYTNGTITSATGLGYIDNDGCVYTNANKELRVYPENRFVAYNKDKPSESIGYKMIGIYNKMFTYVDDYMRDVSFIWPYTDGLYFSATNGCWVTKDLNKWEYTKYPYFDVIDAVENGENILLGKKDSVWFSTNGKDFVSTNLFDVLGREGNYHVSYGNGIYMAIGESVGTTQHLKTRCNVYTSADGNTWNATNTTTFVGAFELKYLAGKFIATGINFDPEGGDVSYCLYSSTNGDNWAVLNSSFPGYAVTKVDNDLYMVGIRNDGGVHTAVSKSSDNGNTWTTPVNICSYSTVSAYSLASGNGLLTMYFADGNPRLLYTEVENFANPWSEVNNYTWEGRTKWLHECNGIKGVSFAKNKFWLTDGTTNVLYATDFTDLSRLPESGKTFPEYAYVSHDAKYVEMPLHNKSFYQLEMVAITNRVWKDKAKEVYNTNTVVQGTCENGFVSQQLNTDVYIIRGDVIRTTGIESETNTTRAVLIYEK